MGSLFDRKRHMMDVAVHLRRGLQGNRLSADDAGDLAAHDNLATGDHSRHLPFLANDDLGCLDIAFNLAIDLQDAPADDLQTLADDLEVIANDRFFTTRRRANGRLRTGRSVGASRTGRARRLGWT